MNAYKTNIVCALFFLLVAALVWFLIPVGIKVSSNYSMGNTMLNSQFMPRVLVIVLALSCLSTIFMNLISLKLARDSGKPAPTIKIPRLAEEKHALALAVVLLLFWLMLSCLGFIPAGLVSSVAILVYLRVKTWYYYVISAGFVFFMYYVFTSLLYVSLP